MKIEAKHVEEIIEVFGLQGKELARVLGVSEATVSRWRRGDFKPEGVSRAALKGLYLAAKECKTPRARRLMTHKLFLGIGTMIYLFLSLKPRRTTKAKVRVK